MAKKGQEIYVFGEFSLDSSKRVFLSGSQTVHLPAKEFDTLLYFVRNSGRILSKEEMMSAIWDDTFVEEGNLAQYVSRLRKILNSNGHNYIQTLPKKGYRFDADVVTEEETRHAPSRRTIWIIAALVAGLGSLSVFLILRDRPADVVNSVEPAPIILTDGKQDDEAVEWTSDNQIRFYRQVSPKRLEAWIMNLDGSDPHRENTAIKDLLVSVWSPDRKKVFFMKDGDNKTTYLANADGTDETALPLLVGNSDWAPDSSKFVYETKVDGNAEIFLYTVATRQNVNLTHNIKTFDADPSFSPDGKRVAFLSDLSGNPDIYTMDVDGKNLTQLTDHPAWDSFPVFAPDGTQLLFLSNRDSDSLHVYVKNLNDDTPPVRLTDFSGIQGFRAKCWSPDGTQIIFSSDVSGKDQIVLMNVEPYKSKLFLADQAADIQFPRISPDGSKLVYQARLADRSVELRLMEMGSKKTQVLYKTPAELPPAFAMSPSWAPDGSHIAFCAKTTQNADIYTINIDGSGLRQLTDDPAPDMSPAYSADGREIFFARDFYGQPKLFRMKADGSEARRVTDKGGYEFLPAASPDGTTLLFSGDRQDGESKGLDIFSLDLNAPGLERILLSRPLHEVETTFSPDGKKLAFVAESDGNREIYLMNADGSGLLRLTRNKAVDSAPTFSADGKNIVFSSNRNGKFELFEIAIPY